MWRCSMKRIARSTTQKRYELLARPKNTCSKSNRLFRSIRRGELGEEAVREGYVSESRFVVPWKYVYIERDQAKVGLWHAESGGIRNAVAIACQLPT